MKKILLVVLIVLVIIQFIHPKKNKSEGEQTNYIGKAFNVPNDVKVILAKACNDCHSNNTNYPWYTSIQPVDWWMNHHVNDGKKHLNLDEYTNKSLRFQYHKMEEVVEMIKEGEMPLDSYTWIHKEAKLTEEETSTLINWADDIRENMKSQYPLDSLIRKK
ncbi:MAG: heme-binding domain-containing protein [Chitinophagaceae bacterium]